MTQAPVLLVGDEQEIEALHSDLAASHFLPLWEAEIGLIPRWLEALGGAGHQRVTATLAAAA